MTQPANIVDILSANGAAPKVLEIDLQTTPQVDEECGVKINGTFYPYAAVNDWSLSRRNRFAALWNQMEKLERKETVSEEDEERYSALSQEFLTMCAPTIDPDLLSQMGVANRTAMAMDFFLKVAVRHPVFRTLAGFTQRTGTN